jgi:hypothetical protein
MIIDKSNKNWERELESFLTIDLDGTLFLQDFMERITQGRVWNDTFQQWSDVNLVDEDEVREEGYDSGHQDGYEYGYEAGFEGGIEEGRQRAEDECEDKHGE